MKFQILPNGADTAEAFEDVDPPRRERRLYGHSILKTETYSKYSQHIRENLLRFPKANKYKN